MPAIAKSRIIFFAVLLVVLSRTVIFAVENDIGNGFPRVTLATPIVSKAPDWIVIQGDAEYQHFTLPVSDTQTKFHGKVFVGNEEKTAEERGEELTCALGKFIWQGILSDANQPEGSTGWFPLLNTLELGSYNAECNMDVSGLVNREADLSKASSSDNAWVFWYHNPENPRDGGYGALCVDGKWVLGRELEQRAQILDSEFVWNGPFVSGAKTGLYGWSAVSEK